MSEESLNIKVFKKLSNKHFQEGLDRAPSMLKPKQVTSFYQTVLAHFQKGEIPFEIGDSILKTIYKCLKVKENIPPFIEGQFAALLPLKQTNLLPTVFDIFHVIISSDPTIVDETFSQIMPTLIKFDAKKSLTLIALYCQQFSEIDNPWPMVDLLIQEAANFNQPQIASDYISLLSFLNKRFIEYRNGRAQHCWNQVMSMLNTTDKKTIVSCYGGLCAIADGFTGGTFQIELIATHLLIPEIQDPALSLLNFATLNEKDAGNKKLIQSLMQIAEKNVRASLVLMKLAYNSNSASTAIFSTPGWMQKPLPTMIDTLRIFLVILRHKNIRESVAESTNFVDFLKSIISLDKPGVVPIACTIIRRVPLSKDLITQMSYSGFLDSFYNAPDENDDGLTQHSKLLLTDTICRVTFVKDYVLMCDKINNIIVSNGEFADAAALVAIRLCKYPKCKARMKELKLDQHFKKVEGGGKMASTAKKFLKAINGSEE
ncbi:hypothetical protein TVAG_110600 [Trichomonas vaginalis G3]|uniref:Uncharacterized protein n=1 Tax=Trichomonas vaginalis (strain ATCC PRA-98 / G3) TaxID=412133 RepID=A2DGR1_TRIV3|nr:protein kinase protein [Trichomonas vaginalis G3]EAY20448.1 hypothetical protein TVAG_110600 [Trichomonas vaginalis G3]KAI5490502.1 protein kinase protein [Trichomonas vaginalis G3]|eukprot:XP_001581434.1 hypothetical protein [Trichomonas vaginalis G3]